MRILAFIKRMALNLSVMEYTKLVLGIIFIVAFTLVLYKNIKRSGLLHFLLRIDTVIGMFAGVYLVITSLHSLIP